MIKVISKKCLYFSIMSYVVDIYVLESLIDIHNILWRTDSYLGHNFFLLSDPLLKLYKNGDVPVYKVALLANQMEFHKLYFICHKVEGERIQ